MDPKNVFERLIREARQREPDDRVPYAFEQRIMRAIRQEPRLDAATLWAAGLWHAVLPCSLVAAVAITLSVTFLRVQEPELGGLPVVSDQTESVEAAAPAASEFGDSSGEALW